MSEPQDELLDHDYDGIQEYDNPLPGWWLALFYICVAFALVYLPWYWMGPGQSAIDEYTAEMAAFQSSAAPQRQAIDPAALRAAAGDPVVAKSGGEVFAKLCAACHTATGAGLVGPNLTDDYWLHGGRLEDVARVVTEGVPEKGMIAWKSQLGPEEIIAVSVYIKTLRGTNPPNPKAPEGQKYDGD